MVICFIIVLKYAFMINSADKTILRGLAEQYRQISDDSIQTPRRRAWSRLNSLLDHKPLIYVRAFAAKERADCKLTTTDRKSVV